MCASAAFEARFGTADTLTFWAPGRVNLIGEHIDYCGGTVLPMPLRFGTHVEIARRPAASVRIFSTMPNETIELNPRPGSARVTPRGHWSVYAAGVIRVLADTGYPLDGADIHITSDIPGSGLSSSASFCVALAMALAQSNGHELAGLPLARVCRRVEHEFAGVQCGLMDQAVIVLGQAQAALCFDCANETGRAVPLVAPRPSLLVIDSGKPRTLTNSAYNTRLEETRRAAAVLGVPHERLALADPDVLTHRPRSLDLERARHVICEHRRVLDTVRAINGGDWGRVGALFDESHESLRVLYAVSCAELDLLVQLVHTHDAVMGARMTGAGFGGSIVALVNGEDALRVAAEVAVQYRERTGVTPRSFVAESIGGATELHD